MKDAVIRAYKGLIITRLTYQQKLFLEMFEVVSIRFELLPLQFSIVQIQDFLENFLSTSELLVSLDKSLIMRFPVNKSP